MDADGYRHVFSRIRDGGDLTELVREVTTGGMEGWNEAIIGLELARLENRVGLERFDENFFRRELIDLIFANGRREGRFEEVINSVPAGWRSRYFRNLAAVERRAIMASSDGPRRITEDIDRLMMENSEDLQVLQAREFERMRAMLMAGERYTGVRAYLYNMSLTNPILTYYCMQIRHYLLLMMYYCYLMKELDAISASYLLGIFAWVHPVVILAAATPTLVFLWRRKRAVLFIVFASVVYYSEDTAPYLLIERGVNLANDVLVSIGNSAIRSYMANEINVARMLMSIYVAPVLRFLGYRYESDGQSVVAVVRGVVSLLSMTAPYVLIFKEVMMIRRHGGNTLLALFNRMYRRSAVYEAGFNWENESIHLTLGFLTSGPWYLVRWAAGGYLCFAPLVISILRVLPFSAMILWTIYPLIPLIAVAYTYQVRGWCYLNVTKDTLEARRMLKTMGYAPYITADTLMKYVFSYPRAIGNFRLSKVGEYFHVEQSNGGEDRDDLYEQLLAEPLRLVGSAMGNWRMTRGDQNPLSRLHTRVKNTAEGIIRSKGLTPIAGLIARSTEFTYISPLKHRISGLNRIQEQAVKNEMMARNMVAKEDALAAEVVVPFIKTGLNLNSKAAKTISERTGVVLVSEPSVGGPHEAAVVLRTKFLLGVSERETNAGVGMIIFAPSVLEMHLFPLAVWLYVEGADGFDVERADGGCACPSNKVCEVRAAAAQDGRWIVDRDWKSKQVRHACSKYGVNVGLMTHIEPNVSPREIMEMQLVLGVSKIYSLMNFAIRPIFGESTVDTITDHTFVRHGGQIVCGFDSGTYSHDVRQFEKICEVVENGKGQWQKREIIFEVERTVASILHISTSSRGGVAIAYRPGMHSFYVLPAPSITGIKYVLVRRNAYDNLLGRLSTKVKVTIEDIMQAIRGSSVTLTISGASVQPRFDQSWDEARAIANFTFIYLNAKVIVNGVLEDLKKNETILTWLTKASHLAYEQMAKMYGGEIPELSIQQVQDVLANITEKSRQLPLGTISEVCTRRFFGPATKAVKATAKPTDRFHSMGDLVQMYKRGHDADLSSTLDLTLKISKRWLAENVSIVADGAVVAQTAWSGLWSFAEEIFRKQDDMPNAEKCRLLRQKFDWTKYNAPEVIRALLECVVGDSLTFLSAAKHLVSTIIGSYTEADRNNIRQAEILATAETIQRFRDAAENQPPEEVTEANIILWYTELYELYMDEQPTAIGLFHDNFFPMGNDRAAYLRSYNQVLDKFFDYRRNLLGERVIPYQDIFHSIVTIFGSMRGVTNRAKLLDAVIAKVTSEVGLEMAPVLRELTRKVEERAQENIAEAAASVRQYAEGEKLMETEMGDRLPLRNVEIEVNDVAGRRIDLEAAERHDAPVRMLARDGRTIDVYRFADKGILTDDEMTRMAGQSIAWSTGPGGPSREATNAFVGTTQIGARMFEEFDRLVSGARVASSLEAVYDENSFDVEMEDFIHDPAFGNLAQDVNNFTQYQTAAPATYVAHLRGLPASMKSAFMRKHLDHRDIVVAPSKKLKLSWEKELADIPRDRRPRVLTQHTALLARSERFVVIDEVYTMGRQHVAALSKIAGRGLITLGDPSQIRVAFNHAILFNFEHLATYRFQSMLSFIPFDALLVYLNNADMSLFDLNIPFISVCSPLRGLKFVQSLDVILNGDLHITMNQDGAANRRGRGQLNTRTAHEVQGSRAKEAVVYLDAHQTNAFSNSLMHFGVAISRSTEYTVLVTQRGVDYSRLPGVAFPRVNGGLMKHYSQYDPTGYLDFMGKRADDVDLEDTKQYAEKDWQESRFEEEMFEEAIEPASFLVGNTPITTDDFENETKFIYPVDKCVKKISADWVYEKIKSEVKPAFLIKGGKMNVLHNHLQRAKEKEKVKKSHRENAKELAKRFFENDLLDKTKFVEYYQLAYRIHDYHKKRPEQLRSYLQATGDRKAELFASAFAKNAYAKKTAQEKMKFQGVISSNKVIQGLFMKMVFALTFAFKYALREGADIDVGMDDEELFAKIARIQAELGKKRGLGFMMDLELQDSTHNPNHIATMSELLRIAGEDEEIIRAFEHVREGEEIVDIHGQFVLSSAVSLSSGAPWTLISNILMMFTSVLNEYEIPKRVLFLQKGDDLTASEAFPRRTKVVDLRVVWKIERGKYADFTSKAAIAQFRIRKNMRLFLSAAFDRRSQIKHEAWGKELRNFLYEIEAIGFDEWVRLRFEIFSIDPTGAEDIVRKAIAITRMSYEELPEEYKLKDSRRSTKRVMISETEKCAYHAMSHVVSSEDLGYLRDQLYYDDVDWVLIRRVAADLNVRVKFHESNYPGDNGVEPYDRDMGVVQVWRDHAMVWLTAEQYAASMETKSEKDDRERGERMDYDF